VSRTDRAIGESFELLFLALFRLRSAKRKRSDQQVAEVGSDATRASERHRLMEGKLERSALCHELRVITQIAESPSAIMGERPLIALHVYRYMLEIAC